MPKDNRKQYKYEPIRIADNVVNFDGKLNRTTNQLKIYRLYGDVRLFNEAIEQFCRNNKIDKAIVV